MFSTICTTSQAVGTGAPVMIRTHSPGPTGPFQSPPAATSATIDSVTGAAAMSAARMANPSIMARSNGG